jgi:hypothetical protein
VPAAVSEREAAEDLLRAGPAPRDVLADKGFNGRGFAASHAACGTTVLVPPGKRQRAAMPSILQKVIAEWRNRIETTSRSPYLLGSPHQDRSNHRRPLRRRYLDKAELAAAVIGSLRVAEPPAGAPSPRAYALAILENFHRNLRAIPALAILGSLLAEEDRHPELRRLFKTRLVEPRRALLRQALAAGDLPDSADLDALTSMLIGSFYGRYVTIAGIPDDWPDRVLSAVWPKDGQGRKDGRAHKGGRAQ